MLQRSNVQDWRPLRYLHILRLLQLKAGLKTAPVPPFPWQGHGSAAATQPDSPQALDAAERRQGEGWLVFRAPSVRPILFTGCRPNVFHAGSLPLSLTSLQLGDSRHFQRPPGARPARAHAQSRPFPRRGLEPIGAPLSRRPVPPPLRLRSPWLGGW